MDSVRYKVTWKTFLLPLVGLAAFFAYVYVFNVDIQEIAGKIQHINLGFYLLAVVAALLDTAFFTLAWRSLLRFVRVEISVAKAFLFVWIGIFVDTLIPAESVSGEVSKIYLVNREQSGTAGPTTASLVAQRLIGMGINLATLLAGAVLLLVESLLQGMIMTLILFLVVVTTFFLVMILLLCIRSDWTFKLVTTIIRFAERISGGRWKLAKLREELVEAVKAFHIAMKEYTHAPKTLLVASSLSLLSWLFTMLVLYFTFVSMGYPQISWSAILVVSAIFAAVKSIPIGIPFEVGLPEITLTTLLWFFVVQWEPSNVAWQISATATILMRLLTLWLRFFIGFAAQQWMGIKAIKTNKDAQANPVQD